MNLDEKRLIEIHGTAVASITIGKTVGVNYCFARC